MEYFKIYECLDRITKRSKRRMSDVIEIALKISKSRKIHRYVREVSTLLSKEKKADRILIYDALIERIQFPASLRDKYYEYMEFINPIDRLSYIDRIRSMSKKKLEAHMLEMYVNPLIEEIGQRFTDEERKRTHRDLYGFKNEPQSMILITMAFLKKIREIPQEKRKPFYRKYADLDVEKLKKEGLSTDTIKSRILTGLIETLVQKNERDQRRFIEDLFDPEYSF